MSFVLVLYCLTAGCSEPQEWRIEAPAVACQVMPMHVAQGWAAPQGFHVIRAECEQ